MTRIAWVLGALGVLLLVGTLAGVAFGPVQLDPKRLVMALLDAGCLAETLIAFFQECLRF